MTLLHSTRIKPWSKEDRNQYFRRVALCEEKPSNSMLYGIQRIIKKEEVIP